MVQEYLILCLRAFIKRVSAVVCLTVSIIGLVLIVLTTTLRGGGFRSGTLNSVRQMRDTFLQVFYLSLQVQVFNLFGEGVGRGFKYRSCDLCLSLLLTKDSSMGERLRLVKLDE